MKIYLLEHFVLIYNPYIAMYDDDDYMQARMK